MDGDLPTVRLSPYFDTRYTFELSFQCCRFKVNQHPVAEVMPVVLKSGQSASREKAVEEMKDCRSTVHPCHRSTVMPERGLSIFYDRLKPRSNHKLPEYPWTTWNPIYVISKPLLTATLSIIHYSWRRSILLQRLIGTPLVLPLIYLSIIQIMFCVTVCMSE